MRSHLGKGVSNIAPQAGAIARLPFCLNPFAFSSNRHGGGAHRLAFGANIERQPVDTVWVKELRNAIITQ